MNKKISREAEYALAKHIATEYKTKTVRQICEEMHVSHPEFALTYSKIGSIINRLKKAFDRRSAECRLQSRYADAAVIDRKKHQ